MSNLNTTAHMPEAADCPGHVPSRRDQQPGFPRFGLEPIAREDGILIGIDRVAFKLHAAFGLPEADDVVAQHLGFRLGCRRISACPAREQHARLRQPLHVSDGRLEGV